MLLEKKNGTIWSLKTKPDRKVLRALSGALKRRSTRQVVFAHLGFIAILAVPLIWILVLPIEEKAETAILLCYFFVCLVGGSCVILRWSIVPLENFLILDRIVYDRGGTYIKDYIHEKHFAFQLIAPLLSRSSSDPELATKISNLFKATEDERTDVEWYAWDASSDPDIYRRIYDKRHMLLESALHLAKSQSDATELQAVMRTHVQKENEKSRQALLEHRVRLEHEAANINAVLHSK